MQIKALHENFIMPTKGTDWAAAHDIYMPSAGYADNHEKMIGLGFAASVPQGHVGLLLPRSGTGAKFGLELNNTCGVIDPDYQGEWMACLRTKNGERFEWNAGDRILQFIVVPCVSVGLIQVNELAPSNRTGGFGSTGT